MKRNILTFVVLSMALVTVQAQDMTNYKRIVKELSSSRYQGRGYARNGVVKAGRFIHSEFVKAGADEVTDQPFCIDVNTFPSSMRMSVDGRKLEAGSDFVMREYSPGVHGKYGLYYIDTLNFDPEKLFSDLERPENRGAFVVCDFWFTYRFKDVFRKLQNEGGCSNAGLIYVWDTPLKFYKAYAEKVVDKPIVWVSSDFPSTASAVSFDIDNKFLEDYESNNVIAKVNGKRHDSCYVFTAHYDHLGNLGRKVYYPGANDNASGTSAIITLAAHYAANKPEYDMYFLAFSGEDANLRGSSFFVDNPFFPLSEVKYLFNLDMVGDNNRVQYCEVSPEGLEGFRLMEEINRELSCFESLNRGELAANSDHYPFAKRGVPCIMFENENGKAFPNYHTPQDNWENAIFSTYEPIFRLVTTFVSRYR